MLRAHDLAQPQHLIQDGFASRLPSDRPRAPSSTAAVLALAVGGFGIGTGEFAIMGLLPEVAADLGVSIPTAGHVISAYALGVVVGAPVLAVLGARLPRRALLMALMLFFALGNFASALAPGYLSLNLLRFITGLPHGTYFGVAALVAAGLAPPLAVGAVADWPQAASRPTQATSGVRRAARRWVGFMGWVPCDG